MSKDEMIKRFANEFVTEDEMDNIWESECVAGVENCGSCGNSELHGDATWYTVVFTDGDEMSIYLK